MRSLWFKFIILIFIIGAGVGLFQSIQSKNIGIDKTTTAQAQTTAYDWPQVQNNPQHTGFSPETLGTNIRVAWTHPFQPEKIYPQVQPIVYQGKVFVGTEMGNMYALNATTGAQAWKHSVGAPILASVAAANGQVFFGAMDGAVYALDANSGNQVWKTQLSSRLGFSTAPVFADNKIMLGGRSGRFYALDPSDGGILWQYDVGAPIYQTAAVNNGKVYFGAMNMRVYAINTTNGQFVWISQKLFGMAFKDYWPVVYGGYVFVRPTAKAEVLDPNSTTSQKSFYVLNESNGQEPFTVYHTSGQTMNGATTPPCVDRDGYLIVPVIGGPQGWQSGWGRLDLATHNIHDTLTDSVNSGAGWGNSDETFSVTCAQNLVLTLQVYEEGASYTGVYDQNNHRWIHVNRGTTSLQMQASTAGGGNDPPAVANGMIFHISIHELVARTTN